MRLKTDTSQAHSGVCGASQVIGEEVQNGCRVLMMAPYMLGCLEDDLLAD